MPGRPLEVLEDRQRLGDVAGPTDADVDSSDRRVAQGFPSKHDHVSAEVRGVLEDVPDVEHVPHVADDAVLPPRRQGVRRVVLAGREGVGVSEGGEEHLAADEDVVQGCRELRLGWLLPF